MYGFELLEPKQLLSLGSRNFTQPHSSLELGDQYLKKISEAGIGSLVGVVVALVRVDPLLVLQR